MARFLRSKKEDIGIAPDALHFRGDKKTDKTRLRVFDYNEETLTEMEVEKVSELLKYRGTNSTSWINIDGLYDTELLEALATDFNIESLALSDILDTHMRPKVHEYDTCILISVKMLRYDEALEEIIAENLVLILKENLLLTFQEQVGDVFNPIRERLRKNKKRIRSAGPDYLAFALLDIVIDNYIYLISLLGEQIEALDDELIQNPSMDNLREINDLKSEINFLRKNVKPCREMVLKFTKLDSDLIDEGMYVHFQELQNNIDMANEAVDGYREILSDQLNVFHTNVTNRLNDILKFLTIFSVIFIPLTFIAGVYGTNFDHIPELHFRYSYFIMLGVMLLIASGMIIYFKRKKWL
jgi:magnesium transporter